MFSFKQFLIEEGKKPLTAPKPPAPTRLSFSSDDKPVEAPSSFSPEKWRDLFEKEKEKLTKELTAQVGKIVTPTDVEVYDSLQRKIKNYQDARQSIENAVLSATHTVTPYQPWRPMSGEYNERGIYKFEPQAADESDFGSGLGKNEKGSFDLFYPPAFRETSSGIKLHSNTSPELMARYFEMPDIDYVTRSKEPDKIISGNNVAYDRVIKDPYTDKDLLSGHVSPEERVPYRYSTGLDPSSREGGISLDLLNMYGLDLSSESGDFSDEEKEILRRGGKEAGDLMRKKINDKLEDQAQAKIGRKPEYSHSVEMTPLKSLESANLPGSPIEQKPQGVFDRFISTISKAFESEKSKTDDLEQKLKNVYDPNTGAMNVDELQKLRQSNTFNNIGIEGETLMSEKDRLSAQVTADKLLADQYGITPDDIKEYRKSGKIPAGMKTKTIFDEPTDIDKIIKQWEKNKHDLELERIQYRRNVDNVDTSINKNRELYMQIFRKRKDILDQINNQQRIAYDMENLGYTDEDIDALNKQIQDEYIKKIGEYGFPYSPSRDIIR